MANSYKLSFSGQEIDEKLGNVENHEERIAELEDSIATKLDKPKTSKTPVSYVIGTDDSLTAYKAVVSTEPNGNYIARFTHDGRLKSKCHSNYTGKYESGVVATERYVDESLWDVEYCHHVWAYRNEDGTIWVDDDWDYVIGYIWDSYRTCILHIECDWGLYEQIVGATVDMENEEIMFGDRYYWMKGDNTLEVYKPQGKYYERIETIKTTQSLTTIERTEEPNGTPYDFERIFIKIANKKEFTSDFIVSVEGWRNDTRVGYGQLNFNTSMGYGAIEISKEYQYWTTNIYAPSTNAEQYGTITRGGADFTLTKNYGVINKLIITSNLPMLPGAINGIDIEIWGVRS